MLLDVCPFTALVRALDNGLYCLSVDWAEGMMMLEHLQQVPQIWFPKISFRDRRGKKFRKICGSSPAGSLYSIPYSHSCPLVLPLTSYISLGGLETWDLN